MFCFYLNINYRLSQEIIVIEKLSLMASPWDRSFCSDLALGWSNVSETFCSETPPNNNRFSSLAARHRSNVCMNQAKSFSHFFVIKRVSHSKRGITTAKCKTAPFENKWGWCCTTIFALDHFIDQYCYLHWLQHMCSHQHHPQRYWQQSDWTIAQNHLRQNNIHVLD